MADKIRWGIDNPHPLSQMRTELVWEGKYDEYGKRQTVDIAGKRDQCKNEYVVICSKFDIMQ